jgi:beta-lactamase regulating signal transducer with metallopeptidase domain
MITSIPLEEHNIHALVWTIIHSIWQFTIIGVIMSVLLKWYQDHTSNTKYIIALGSLMAAFITSVTTFLYYNFTFAGSQTIDIFNISVLQVESKPVQSDLLSYLYSWIERYRIPIFITWISGVVLFGLKFFFSLGYVEFLSRTSVPVCCQDTYRSFRRLCVHYQIKENITFGESRYVKTPMILGFLKPVILFPVGIINHLDAKETEAILAHELAHFVRKDIYINIIQTLLEALFYYHPAIWWISSNIRLERESCCDDLAINFLGDHLHYAKTLVKVQDIYINSTAPVLAMNFSKKESFFSNRIKRILNMAQTRNYLKEKIITSVVLIGLVMLFTKDLTGSSLSVMNGVVEQNITVMDTFPAKKESIRIQKKTNDQEIKISIENGKVTDLEIDGKKIDEKDYDKYEGIIQEVKPDSQGNGNAKMFYFGDEEMKPFGFGFGNENEMMDSLFKGFNFKGFGNFEFNQDNLNEQMQKLKEQLGKMKFDFGGVDSMNFNFDGFAFPEMKDMEIAPNFKFFDFEGDGPEGFNFDEKFPGRESDHPEGIYDFEKHDSKNFSEAVGNALNRDGLLIPGQENKVELTGKHLKINGEKQPGNIYQKYKRIFEEQSGTTLQKNSKLEFNFVGKESNRKYKVY